MYQYTNSLQELDHLLAIHYETAQILQLLNIAFDDKSMDFETKVRFDQFLLENLSNIRTLSSDNQFHVVMMATNDRDYTPSSREIDQIRRYGYNFDILGRGREISIQKQFELLQKEMDKARSTEERAIVSAKLEQVKVEIFKQDYESKKKISPDHYNPYNNSETNYPKGSRKDWDSKTSAQLAKDLEIRAKITRPLESPEPATAEVQEILDGYKQQYFEHLAKYYYPQGYDRTDSDNRKINSKLDADLLFKEFTNPYATPERLEIIQNILNDRYQMIIDYAVNSPNAPRYIRNEINNKYSRDRIIAKAEREMEKKGLISDRKKLVTSLDSRISNVIERRAKIEIEVNTENLTGLANETISNPDNRIEINLAQDILSNLGSPVDGIAQDTALSVAIEIAKKVGCTDEQISALGDIKNIASLIQSVFSGDPIGISISSIQVAPVVVERFKQYIQNEQRYSAARQLAENQAQDILFFSELDNIKMYQELTAGLSVEAENQVMESSQNHYWETKLNMLKHSKINLNLVQLELEQSKLKQHIENLESQLSNDQPIAASYKKLMSREVQYAERHGREIDLIKENTIKIFKELAEKANPSDGMISPEWKKTLFEYVSTTNIQLEALDHAYIEHMENPTNKKISKDMFIESINIQEIFEAMRKDPSKGIARIERDPRTNESRISVFYEFDRTIGYSSKDKPCRYVKFGFDKNGNLRTCFPQTEVKN
jgi:hypothetical protein